MNRRNFILSGIALSCVPISVFSENESGYVVINEIIYGGKHIPYIRDGKTIKRTYFPKQWARNFKTYDFSLSHAKQFFEDLYNYYERISSERPKINYIELVDKKLMKMKFVSDEQIQMIYVDKINISQANELKNNWYTD